MFVRLTHYATALVFLGAMSVIYQNIVTPWMQPPHVEVIEMSEAPPLRHEDRLVDLFPDGAWQRGLCKQLQTENGMLLFQNWKQIGSDQWKLWPMTVVIGRGMSGVDASSTMILNAPEGAEIKFTESFDVLSGGAPPIHRGRMIGDVHIFRTSDDHDSRSLDLRTANVGIDNKKIWTTETIRMNVGQAKMVGRDLTLHLSGPTGGDVSGAPTVLDRMELIYLDELVMPLEKGGLWDAGDEATAPGSAASSSSAATDSRTDSDNGGGQAVVSVQCGGRVEYDFAIDRLVLHESVSLVHQVAGMVADRFDCQSLELTLNDPTNDSVLRQTPLDWLVEIVATGSPAVMNLPSFDSELAAERIEFDAIAGLVRAHGSRGIRLRRNGITARLARLVYQFDPAQPDAIGTIDAPGAGIVQVDDPAIPVRKAQWLDGFRLEPVGISKAADLATDIQLMIDGQFHAWLTDGGEFKANSLAGYLTPEQNPDGSRSLAPDRLKATGDVRLDTTAIAAETQQLLLFFVAEADPRPKAAQGSDPQNNSPLRQFVVQPPQEGATAVPVARPRPTIRGDSITAQLRRNENGLSAKKLNVSGSVEVVHHLNTADQTLPARLTGEQLDLIDGGGEDILQLGSGVDSPARFELGDGFFVGPQIQIRPSDNIVWINDAGEFQLPTAALPGGIAGDPNGNIQWTSPPHCRWRGEMIFDGRTAVLSDGVDVTAELLNGGEPWQLRMTGDRLQVDLAEGVEVRDMKAMRGATIQRIALMQANQRPVMVQALKRAPDGVLEAKHLIHAAQLNLTPADGGKIIGDGPGWYRGWMRGQDTTGRLGTSNATPIDAASGELTGIHLVFNDSMQVDMMGKHLDFLRGVRVGVRSVSGWDDAFDAKKMDAISIGQSTLDCDRLRFNIEPGYDSNNKTVDGKTPWEMEATSGVFFRTRNDRGLLEGTASRAAYSSSKDLFTVEGAPNRAAIFQHTLPDGTKGHQGAVRTMSIRPGTMKIENAVLERLNIATPPNMGNR